MGFFQIGNINFDYSGEYERQSTVDCLAILKAKHVLDFYSSLLPKDRPVTIFELGVFEAGSAIALAAMNPNARIIGIDFTYKPHLDEIIAAHGLSERIKIYHRVEQQNELRLREILSKHSDWGFIDLVIDDCSHFYEHTRSSFEVLFPYVKSGGNYVVEDWNWAHYPGEYQNTKWVEHPALTNLIFELVMLAGSDSPDIDRITLNGISAVISKKSNPIPDSRLNIKSSIINRNKVITLI